MAPRPWKLAIDPATGEVVGFVSAIGDGGNVAFISLLEVLPAWRGRGVGGELVRRLLARLGDRYTIDLGCDEGLVPFYERLRADAGPVDGLAEPSANTM